MKTPTRLYYYIHSFFFLFACNILQAQNVGIGTTSPTASLHVNGSFKLNNGTEGLGKVLTSDKGGTATWQTITNSQAGGVGFGTWGDCSTRNISEYNPVSDGDGTANSYFGLSTSMSGNYAILGASGKVVNGNTNQGAAYIYFFNGTTWVQQQMLTASDGAVNDYFGISVRMSGNYAIVGARGKTISGKVDQGKAYIFFNNGSSWVQMGTGITASDGAASDYFGFSVGISGTNAIVGAYNKTVGANSSQGKVYFFNYNGSSWVQLGTGATSADGTSGDIFGFSVAINGTNAVVGANNKMINAQLFQGKAYVFKYNGSTWSQAGTGIIAPDGAGDDLFGNSVSINDNYLLIGARLKTNLANTGQGAAYIYFYNGSSWVFHQKLMAGDGAADDAFGSGVWISGNYAMVGAYHKSFGSFFQQGAVYLYQNIGGIWRILQQIKDPAGGSNDLFGYSVCIDTERFVISAHGVENNSGLTIFGKVEK